jgi:hypothetical protein
MRAQWQKMAAACLLLAALILPGCGYKNLPVPPAQMVPKAVTDLHFIEEGKEGRLEWTYPVETVTGANLVAIDSFELFTATIAAKDYCQTCPIPFGPPRALQAGETRIEGKNKTASAPTPELLPGNKYFFKLRSRTSWWVSSEDSNVVTFVWHVTANPPRDLHIKAGTRNLELTWQPPPSMADGSPLPAPVRYQVQRSEDGKAFANIAVLETPRYVDSLVRPGIEYSYLVRALTRLDGEEIAGQASPVATVTIANAPVLLPPSGVSISLTATGTRISWDAVDGAAGYRVYRRAANADDFQRIGEVGPEANAFVDQSARHGVVYYVITTLGAGDGESVQSRPASSR